jgi:hypothetical protein
MAGSGIMAPTFVMGRADQNVPQTVKGILPVSTFLVSYVDGNGKEQVRLALIPEGSQNVFVFQERINGQHVATEATPWFVKEVHKFLEKKTMTDKGIEQVEAPTKE